MIAAIGKRRVDVLSALKASATPMTIAQIADELAVHANTVRFHLEHLEAGGQVERARVHPPLGQGRHWELVPDSWLFWGCRVGEVLSGRMAKGQLRALSGFDIGVE